MTTPTENPFSPNKAIDAAIREMLPVFSEDSQRRMKKAICNAAKAVMRHRDENTDAGARHIFREFIPASILNRCGCNFEYDVNIDGKTPDWFDGNSALLMDSYIFERGGSSPFFDRVISSIATKCRTYHNILTKLSLRFIVPVYLDFFTCITLEECFERRESFRVTFTDNPDAAGNVYAAGVTNMTADNSVRVTDVIKFDSNGSTSTGWPKSFSTLGTSGHSDVAVDAGGAVYVTGDFNGTVDFDPAPNKTKYAYDGPGQAGTFVLKLTTAGNFGWVSVFQNQTSGSIRGYAYAYPQSIALDGTGNVIVGGYYEGLVDFNPGNGVYRLPDMGSGQGYVTKLNSSGSLVWANPLSSTNGSWVHGVAVDAAGAVYATGGFYGTLDFDPRPDVSNSQTTPASFNNSFVVKYTAAGSLAWAGAFLGNSGSGSGIAVDPAGTISVIGYFRGPTDFDPDPLSTHELTTSTTTQMYLVKLRQN